MTLASILFPHWVSMDVQAHNSDKTFSQHLGLHHYCNSALSDKPCRMFPEEDLDCDPNDKYFCSMWRTTGFLMSFATVAELATLVGFVVTIGGGSVKREYGWKVLCGLLAVVSVAQFAAMGLVVGSRQTPQFPNRQGTNAGKKILDGLAYPPVHKKPYPCHPVVTM